MECPINKKLREINKKDSKKSPKKIKDTHILCILPDKLTLNSLIE